MSAPERRRFPRFHAPVYYRPAGPAFLHHRRATIDVGLGGMRVYTDDLLAVGTPLEIELMLDEATSVQCWVRIAWVEALPDGSSAAFEVGLEFTDIADPDRTKLQRALKPQFSPGPAALFRRRRKSHTPMPRTATTAIATPAMILLRVM